MIAEAAATRIQPSLQRRGRSASERNAWEFVGVERRLVIRLVRSQSGAQPMDCIAAPLSATWGGDEDVDGGVRVAKYQVGSAGEEGDQPSVGGDGRPVTRPVSRLAVPADRVRRVTCESRSYMNTSTLLLVSPCTRLDAVKLSDTRWTNALAGS